MTLYTFKGLFALIILMTAVLAGLKTIRQTDAQDPNTHFNKTAQAFACGIFLGAGLLHMLGESSKQFYLLDIDYPYANLITGSVFLSLLWLEHIGREIFQSDGKRGASFAILAAFMLSIHSFFEGAAIGLAIELPLIFTICLAIFAHKWAASFSLSVQIASSNLKQQLKYVAFFIFCAMTPLGILLGHITATSLDEIKLLIPILNAAAAGTFLYLGTLHGLDYAVMVKKCCHLREFAFLVLGFILMSVVAVYT